MQASLTEQGTIKLTRDVEVIEVTLEHAWKAISQYKELLDASVALVELQKLVKLMEDNYSLEQVPLRELARRLEELAMHKSEGAYAHAALLVRNIIPRHD